MRGQNWLRVNESVLSPDEASKSNSLRGSPVAINRSYTIIRSNTSLTELPVVSKELVDCPKSWSSVVTPTLDRKCGVA
jgi:hypothetical protein